MPADSIWDLTRRLKG